MNFATDDPPPPSVLVVEDEPKTREALAEGLGMEAWRVVVAVSGEEAEHLLVQETFDLLLLDRMLPDCDGLDVLRRLRERGCHTPALVLTARGEITERVAGLSDGADDYLLKPFAFAELVARCRALLRRPVIGTGLTLHYGDLQLDLGARAVFRAGREVLLTPREVDVLEYLLRNQGRIVTREMLERDVWKETHRFTSLDGVISVQMMRLRRKLEDSGAGKLIHTLRGQGYRLGRELK